MNDNEKDYFRSDAKTLKLNFDIDSYLIKELNEFEISYKRLKLRYNWYM